MIHADAKEQVRQATDIVELVGKYLDLRRQGRHFVGLCPWHNDRRPSLQVNQDRQTWKCWVCDIGGDVFSFVMQKEGCDFREALQMLADRAGIQLSPHGQRRAEPGSPDDKNTLLACCEWATRQFHDCLLKSDAAKEARAYVEDRAITPFSVERFAIGFAPEEWTWLIDRAKGTPYSPKVLEAAGLAGQSDGGRIYDRFKGRLIFPIGDSQGRTIAFAGRVLPSNTDPRAGKYINCPETRLYSKSDTLYALDIARNAATKSRELIVVEGYTDVILSHQCGVGEAIACCGTAVTERHIRTLKRFADTIYLVLDGDEAGQRRTNEILELFVAAHVDLRIMTLPDELDPAEFMLDRGGEAFRALLRSATDALEHKIRIATRGVDLVRDTHRANQALEDILATIARGTPPGSIDSAGLRAHQLLARLARQFQLDDGDLRTRFNQLRRNVKSRADAASDDPMKPTSSAKKPVVLNTLERELIEVLVRCPTLVPVALSEITDNELTDSMLRQVFAVFRCLEESGRSPDFSTVLGEIEDPIVKKILVDIDEDADHKDQLQRKDREIRIDEPTRLRTVIRKIRQLHEERARRQTEAALENKVFNPEEAHNVLLQMIADQRRQRGLTAPTDG